MFWTGTLLSYISINIGSVLIEYGVIFFYFCCVFFFFFFLKKQKRCFVYKYYKNSNFKLTNVTNYILKASTCLYSRSP